jgi:exopolysaccharide production protein ExoQ
MPKAALYSTALGQKQSSAPWIDTCSAIPILICIFCLIVDPLINYADPRTHKLQTMAEPGLSNRIFWPTVIVITIAVAVRHYSRLVKLKFPTPILCLLAYAAFAGASVLWAFRPELSFIRFLQQAMILTSIIIPAMLAARTTDIMRGVFLCFALGSILNVAFLTSDSPSLIKLTGGYSGYFAGKNALGEFAAPALLFALHETLYRGHRRVLGIVISAIAILLLYLSNSKTALGLALFAPILAGLTLMLSKLTRISPALILLPIPLGYAVLSVLTGNLSNRLSYMLYGDPTFTGRTVIWQFANLEIRRRRLLGWGYQSFWLVGPDAPSIIDAPGWVKNMPNSHNGYYDTMLELGYVGLALLIIFIMATIHAIGRSAERQPTRVWFLLSVALFVILYNFLESFWMRGFEFVWIVFVIVAVEAARYSQLSPAKRVAYGTRHPRQASPNPSRDGRRLRL